MHGSAVLRRAVCVALFCAAASLARADNCPTAGAEPAHLASVGPRLELKLGDGRLLRIAGIEAAANTPSVPDRGTAAVAALAARIGQSPLAVTILSPKPDRWGRLPAFVSMASGTAGTGGLAAMALAAGLARYRPEAVATACRGALLAAEDEARRARRGLWADPSYSVLAAGDRAAFAERVGTDVVVEARLRAVEPGPYRTRLRFDTADTARSGWRGRTFEATAVPKTMKVFAAQGVDLPSMVGRILRVRGLLDRRFGPRIELAGPDDIELVPESVAPARPN